MTSIRNQAEEMFINAARKPTPSNAAILDFMIECPDLVSKKVLEEAFLSSKSYLAVHQKLWTACKKYFSSDEQDSLLARHLSYQDVCSDFNELKKIKDADLKRDYDLKLFGVNSIDAQLHERRKILADLPDRIEINQRMALNVTSAQLSVLRMALSKLALVSPAESKIAEEKQGAPAMRFQRMIV